MEVARMGHHLKGQHGKKTNANGGFLTKLLAGGALVGVGKSYTTIVKKLKSC